jgi:hypothetical protein
MRFHRIDTISIRVLLFGCCLLATREVLSVVLQSQIVNVTIIGLLALAMIVVVLMGMGKIANRLWKISGLAADRVIEKLFTPKNDVVTEASDGKERSA